ncbi:MAG: zinc transporter ZupT [Oscillospiraceae bacterium]|nr:zinc transporter ZupT [Oscillospiraceae bacterium]
MSNIVIAFLLTAVAGLSTGIGSAIAFFAKKTNTRFLAVSLGFSAGVMVYISMIELLTGSMETLSGIYGAKPGTIYALLAFFGGMGLIALIDKLIPENKNPHAVTSPEHAAEAMKDPQQLMRAGVLTALAIAIHNFPEGMATFVSALQEPGIAIPIVVAIAIHNIPEGIAVSVPIYYATGDKKRAFWLSFASGLSEPLGAIIGYLILLPFMSDTLNGLLFSAVGGIMVFISFDELLPSAREYGEHHLSIYGLVGGMAVMALSLWLFM